MSQNRTKFLITVLSVASLTLMGVIVYGTYIIRSTNEETSRLLNLADKRAAEDALAQSIRSIQTGVGGNLKTFDELTLTSDKLVTLIESIEGAGKGLGLATSIVSVNNAEVKNASENQPQIINIVVEAVGSWAKAMSFIKAVESMPHRVMVDEAGLYRSESLWHARMSISLYSFEK